MLRLTPRSAARGQSSARKARKPASSTAAFAVGAFDAAVAAGVLAQSAADVEERLERLDRVHGLVRLVREQELPDGTLTLRYRFVHVLYQNSLYANVPPSRRA